MSTNTIRTRRGLALGLVAVAVLGAGACNKKSDTTTKPGGVAGQLQGGGTGGVTSGGDTGKVYDKDSIGPAMQKALPSPLTAEFTMKMSGDASSLGGSVGSLGGSSGGSTRMTMDMHGSMKVENDQTAMKGSATIAGTSMEMVVADGKTYMKSPMLGGNKWVSTGSSSSSSMMDPKSFTNFGNDVKDLTFVGAEDVGGEKLNHYKVTMKPSSSSLGSGSSGPQSADLYLDDKDHMRKISMTDGKLTIDMTMDKWGEPVTITAPPASDVQDMGGSSLGGSTGSSTGSIGSSSSSGSDSIA